MIIHCIYASISVKPKGADPRHKWGIWLWLPLPLLGIDEESGPLGGDVWFFCEEEWNQVTSSRVLVCGTSRNNSCGEENLHGCFGGKHLFPTNNNGISLCGDCVPTYFLVPIVGILTKSSSEKWNTAHTCPRSPLRLNIDRHINYLL